MNFFSRFSKAGTVLTVALGLLFLPGCPGSVEIKDGLVTLKDVQLPEGCRVLAFYVTIEQEGAEPHQRGPYEVQNGEVEVGRVSGFDLKKPLKITITVAQAVNCGDRLSIGKKFEFDGTLTHEGENDSEEEVFSVKFSQFRSLN